MCGNMKDFNGLIVNGCIEQDIVKYVLLQFQLLAERVGFFLWVCHIESGLSDSDSDDQTDEDSHLSLLNSLLLKIVPEFEHILREYLIHLQEYMVTIINPSISGA
ncbi:hypothetical protein RDI58_014393 [Solanum bulbocastanum]|uniref:Uncharacterized protein n=1 Tax=Solanum bulbocastanum TaxID=147425 RepID=A0AAN8TC75_SOLBU